MPLVLNRKPGEAIAIGDDVLVTYMGTLSGGSARIAVDAPRELLILRAEATAGSALEASLLSLFRGDGEAPKRRVARALHAMQGMPVTHREIAQFADVTCDCVRSTIRELRRRDKLNWEGIGPPHQRRSLFRVEF